MRTVQRPHPGAYLEVRAVAARRIGCAGYVRIRRHVEVVKAVVIPPVHSHRVRVHLRRERGTIAFRCRDRSRRRRRRRLQDDPLGGIARGLEAVNRAPGNVQPLSLREREVPPVEPEMGAAIDHDDGLVRLLMVMRRTVIVGFDMLDTAFEQAARIFSAQHARDGRQREAQVNAHPVQWPHPRLRIGSRVVRGSVPRAVLGNGRHRNGGNNNRYALDFHEFLSY